MRVSTALNRILSLDAATVTDVVLEAGAVVATVRPRARLPRCGCGALARGVYDRSIRRWRHIDLAGAKLLLQAELRRIWCRRCQRVVTEKVPWARHGARVSRDLESLICWLAQRMDKTAVSKLVRVSWETVDRVLERALDADIDPSRLDSLLRIGVDEISYRRHRGYLTVVVDHDTGSVVWAADGKRASTLQRFFDELGPERTARIQAVSRDMGHAYRAAIGANAPQARQCIDPFHVIGLATQAIDQVRLRAQHAGVVPRRDGRALRGLLMMAGEDLSDAQRELLARYDSGNHALAIGWRLKEELRGLYRLDDPSDAQAYFDRWCHRAASSGVDAFAELARRLQVHRDGIIAAVELGLSNARLEGMNSKIRLISHRGYGFHSAAALIAMIYLCCGLLKTSLPHR